MAATTKTFIANIRGIQGVQGVRGVQGLSGTNGDTADAAVASYVGTEGVSASRMALLRADMPQARGFEGLALRTFRAAIRGRTSAPVNIWCMGDSITAGSGAGGIANRWATLFVNELRAHYPTSGATSGGFGFYSVNVNNGTTFVVSGGTVTQSGTFSHSPDGSVYRISAAGNKGVWTFTGTGADVLYIPVTGGGTFYYKVDGGASTTVNTDAFYTGVPVAVPIRGLTSGVHTVEVGYSSGSTSTYIAGMIAYNGDHAEGFRQIVGGVGGTTTNFWTSMSGRPQHWATVYPPDLVVIALGTNDYYHPTSHITAAAYKTNLESIIATFKASASPKVPSFVLLLPGPTNAASPLDPWIDYKAAAQEIAADDYQNVCVYDYGYRINPTDVADTAGGLMDSDLIHPTPDGHALIAAMLSKYVSVQ